MINFQKFVLIVIKIIINKLENFLGLVSLTLCQTIFNSQKPVECSVYGSFFSS